MMAVVALGAPPLNDLVNKTWRCRLSPLFESSALRHLPALPPLPIEVWEIKQIEETGWSLEQHHQSQASTQHSSVLLLLLLGTDHTTWRGAKRHQVTRTSASKEKASGRDMNKGMLVSASKDSIPKGKKRRKHVC